MVGTEDILRERHIAKIEERLKELRKNLEQQNGGSAFEWDAIGWPITVIEYEQPSSRLSIHDLAAIWNTGRTLFKATEAPHPIVCCNNPDAWLLKLEYSIDTDLPIISFLIARTGNTYGVARVDPEHQPEWAKRGKCWVTVQDLLFDPWVLDPARGAVWQLADIVSEYGPKRRSEIALEHDLFDVQNDHELRPFKTKRELENLNIKLAGSFFPPSLPLSLPFFFPHITFFFPVQKRRSRTVASRCSARRTTPTRRKKWRIRNLKMRQRHPSRPRRRK